MADAEGPERDAAIAAGSAAGDPDWAVQLAEAAGEGAQVSDAFGVPVFDVSPERWLETLRAACDAGLTFFDWLSAVDEQDDGFSVVAHVADMETRPLLHLLVRTRITRKTPALPTATPVYRGAAWHERETHEMFGIVFDGHPNLTKLLLPDEFEGHPLRKEFVLAARAAKPWPGAKEPGDGGSGAASPSRRRMQPPGVPDPGWGPRPPGQPAEPTEGGEEAGEAATERASGREASGAKAGGEKAAAKKTAAKKTTKKAESKKTAGGTERGDGSPPRGSATGGPDPGGGDQA